MADIVLSFYIGASQTRPSDLRVSQPARGNNATVHSVTWLGYPFRVQSIEMTHGLNMLGLDVLQQISGVAGGGEYIGGGPVVFVPHTESRVDGVPFQTVTGTAAQAFRQLRALAAALTHIPCSLK